MTRFDEFNMLIENDRRGLIFIELFIGALFLSALIFAYLKSSLMLLSIAILLWIVYILVKILIFVHFSLVAKLIELDRMDKK